MSAAIAIVVCAIAVAHARDQDRATFDQHRNGTQSGADYAVNARKLRAFVWEHWIRRRHGEATVRWSTIEGDTGTSVYTIAPDESGAWHIHVHLEGSQRRMGPHSPAKHRSEDADAYTVERVKMPKTFEERMAPVVRITHQRPLSPATYLVVLKDAEGKSLEDL